MILNKIERSGEHFSESIAGEFKDNLEALNLFDIPLTGGS